MSNFYAAIELGTTRTVLAIGEAANGRRALEFIRQNRV